MRTTSPSSVTTAPRSRPALQHLRHNPQAPRHPPRPLRRLRWLQGLLPQDEGRLTQVPYRVQDRRQLQGSRREHALRLQSRSGLFLFPFSFFDFIFYFLRCRSVDFGLEWWNLLLWQWFIFEAMDVENWKYYLFESKNISKLLNRFCLHVWSMVQNLWFRAICKL